MTHRSFQTFKADRMLSPSRTRALVSTLGLTLVCLTLPAPLVGCPFCTPKPSLSDQIAQSDEAYLVRFVRGEPGRDFDPGSGTYEVLQVMKPDATALKKGGQITLAQFQGAKAGDLFLLTGKRIGGDVKPYWNALAEVSQPAFDYLLHAPPAESSRATRFKYFRAFLESPDPKVANDAFLEFANAPYGDIAACAAELPKDKLRLWLSRPTTPPTRVGIYALMLGLCGDKDDAHLLAGSIARPSTDYRLGLDGMISGYLLLTGSAGLDQVDDWKLKTHDGKKVSASDVYAAIAAVRFMHDFARERIPNERLLQSIRLLLDQPEYCDLAITDLARWNDWSIQGRLKDLYGTGAFNTRQIKQAIIGYMLASTNSRRSSKMSGNGAEPADPATAARGKQYLDDLRKRDPRLVREAERFSFPH